jgi:hypothetical protein
LNIEFFLNKVILMMFSLLSLKNKARLVSFLALASALTASVSSVRAADVPTVTHKISEDNASLQNELLLLSIHQVDGNVYVVSLEKLKTRSKPQDKKPEMSLKTSRKEIQEERMKCSSLHKAETQELN